MKKLTLFLSMFLLTLVTTVFAAEKDSDFDGVADSKDKCPSTAQLKKISGKFIYAVAVEPERLKSGIKAFPVNENGCEFDKDGDGVVNSQDYCPDDSAEALSKGVAVNGCPKQSDYDGTPDYRDNCPNTPKGVKTDRYGCPV